MGLKGNGSKILDTHRQFSGEPMKNSMSIAYSMNKKRKKMADGGMAETEEAPTSPVLPGAQSAQDSMRKAFKFAEGGEAGAMEEDDKDLGQMPVDMKESTEDSDDDLVMRIMKKRYSEGGQVANEVDMDSADKDPAQFDDLVIGDDLESDYGDDDNSGDALGNDQEDEDRKDIVSRIMASRKKKDRLPNPR